ncbi:MAG TPA: ABC transporter permease [Gemmatimonadales bacterium]|nr:ABC transporter permease [Gemmatimonadales bacterium]
MSLLSDLTARLRALLFRSREERELDEELRFHLDMEAEHLKRGGLTTEDAERRSRIDLGGVDPVKEQVRDARGTRLLEDLSRDVWYALRSLRRSRGFALVTVLTLAIGIGGTTAVFSAVNAVLLQPLPYQEPGQLVRIYQASHQNPGARGFLTPVHYVALREQLSPFSGVAAIDDYSPTGADIGSGQSVRRIHVLPTSYNYFDVVRVRPVLGRSYQEADERGPDIEDNSDAGPVVVLSHELWQSQYDGDPSVVGRTIRFDGRAFTVVGVMPAGFSDPIAGAMDAWIPTNLTRSRNPQEADNHYLTAIGRLQPGMTIARAQAELDATMQRLGEQYPPGKGQIAGLSPLKEDIVGGSSRALEVMLGGVGLVLLLVCVNIANLLLVRASERSREFALRTALGAGRVRLVRQLLIESLVLAIAGDVAGLVVARLGMSAIVALGAGTIPRLAHLTLAPEVLGFSLAIATGSALLFGLAPALRAARAQPSDALREQSRSATGGARQVRLREWLVGAQVALAFVLLVGAGLLVASFRRIQSIDLGIKPDNVAVFQLNLPAARYDSIARGRFYETVARQIMALPGVTAAGGISKLPATGPYHQWGTEIQSGPLAGDTKRGNVASQNRVVSGKYFEAAGIPLVAGRYFDDRDAMGTPNRVIINQKFADDVFPGLDPIGQQISQGEIIGVVGDVSTDNEGRQDYYVYHAHSQFAGDRNWSLVQVVKTTGNIASVQGEIRRTIAALDPELVVYLPTTLSEAIGQGAAQRLFVLRILGTFALVALAVSALGIFGVLSYSVRLRSREFGIRMALGAEGRSILSMVLREGMVVTAIGIVAGLLGAVGLARVMASLVFHVSPLDPVVLAGTVLFMACVAAVAAWAPAWRATRVDVREILQ